MKISAFTFLRNGPAMGYPFLESIQSALPLVDEYVVALGDTGGPQLELSLDALASLQSSKVRVVRTVWNESMRTAGFVYGQQKMLAQSYCNGDWALYLEADEVLHEDDLEIIQETASSALRDSRVEALAFKYHHFFGDVNWTVNSPGWYRRAPRMIKNSVRCVAIDGLFWNVVVNTRQLRWPRARTIDAHVYHYGHTRSLQAAQVKQDTVQRYWSKPARTVRQYEIYGDFLQRFSGRHPKIMSDWIETQSNKNYVPTVDYKLTARDRRHVALKFLEGALGTDFSRRHFREVK